MSFASKDHKEHPGLPRAFCVFWEDGWLLRVFALFNGQGDRGGCPARGVGDVVQSLRFYVLTEGWKSWEVELGLRGKLVLGFFLGCVADLANFGGKQKIASMWRLIP